MAPPLTPRWPPRPAYRHEHRLAQEEIPSSGEADISRPEQVRECLAAVVDN